MYMSRSTPQLTLIKLLLFGYSAMELDAVSDFFIERTDKHFNGLGQFIEYSKSSVQSFSYLSLLQRVLQSR